MKRIFLLCLSMCLLLAGCGYDPYDPKVLGFYKGTVIIAEGYEIAMTQVYAGENYVELKEEGRGVLCLAGNPYDIRWGFRGERFFLEIQGEKSEGRIENGLLKLNYLDMGMDLCFQADADYIPGQGYEETLNKEQSFWQGDWYGWWIIDEATGSFADSKGSWWDLCASVTIGSNSRGVITLWDQDSSKAEPLGEVAFYLDEHGAAVSLEGYFGAAEIREGDWYIDPNSHTMDRMLTVSCGAENDTGTFYYTAYLRTWGQDWEDVQEKPYHYEDWYLPMIEAGQPMPEMLP